MAHPTFRAARWLLLTMIVGLAACASVPRPPKGQFLPRELVLDGSNHRYQVFVPATRGPAGTTPVILFLHGSGERGDDGTSQLDAGLGPYVRRNARTFPAIVVFPQAAEHSEWMGQNLVMASAMLDAATAEFGGDPKRTTLTGMSMGGYGTWELAWQDPHRFAALVPVCGALKALSDARKLFVTPVANSATPYADVADRLRDVPIWMFHGARDDSVPPADDRRLARAFAEAGAPDVRYTEFPDANHNAWDPAYAETPELWEWVFAQRLQ